MKPQDIHIGDYNKIVELYHNESDRAAGLLAGSFLEHYLAVFIKLHLVDDPETDELFHGFGPLATFSQRISMGAAMGLIDSRVRTELRAQKEIRNHFAHHPLEATFSDAKLDKHFNKLEFTHEPAINPDGDGSLKDRKLIYLFTVSMLVVKIHGAIIAKKNATPAVQKGYSSLDHGRNVSVDLSAFEKLVNDSAPQPADGAAHPPEGPPVAPGPP